MPTSVAVLEWICGGGNLGSESEAASSLLAEGWAMLSTSVDLLASAGFTTITCVDTRRIGKHRQSRNLQNCQTIDCQSGVELFPTIWFDVAQTADVTLLIAPELNGMLEQAVQSLLPIARTLCNCSDDFLKHSSDKWLTAKRFRAAGIPHPPTALVSEVQPSVLTLYPKATHYVIKPRDGAGCEEILIVDSSDILETVGALAQKGPLDRWILQPQLSGIAMSRAGIVGRTGRAHWLPLTTQDIRFMNPISTLPKTPGHIDYLGGKVLPQLKDYYLSEEGLRLDKENIDTLLDRALATMGKGAFGWLGFDLIYDPLACQWTIIEINPRMTTSFVGLAAACRDNLMEAMIRCCDAGPFIASFRSELTPFTTH